MEKKLSPGIYCHLPFCSVRCIYCDFPITTRMALSERYYDALLTEVRKSPPEFIADTLYFGGGTPSLAPINVLKEIISSVSIHHETEITLEANPDHLSNQKLAAWKSLGINRLSLGMQSTERQVLQLMLRQHTPEEGFDAFRMAREAGFDNLNVDLILGFPKQTANGFVSGLQEFLQFRPDHFSIYMLEIHEGTAIQKSIDSGSMALMEESQQIECFETAIEILRTEGYDHYEVSNFALKNKPSFHNMKYWTDAPYYGYGAGACSYHDSLRTRNQGDVSAYIASIEGGKSGVEETIHEDDEMQARNALIFGLRKIRGIEVDAFEKRYKRSPTSLFGKDLESHLNHGLLEMSHNYLRLTHRGVLLSNEVLTSAIG